MLAAGVPALAVEGDAAAAKAKLSMCIGCHGIEGYRTSYPAVYPVPKLGGQHEDYLFQALQDYKQGRRKDPIMAAQVEALSNEDMADLAAWYARQKGLYVKR